ncbi:transposase [Bradyrhizobium canariense]|uniref:transposase n=1 Tax=Bradyrhizobium canariense TaxID=255045 RepID=UPI00195DB762|nr:transposase [Bradyrhizobium canariense]
MRSCYRLVTPLTFRHAIDDPSASDRHRLLAPIWVVTPGGGQSGETDIKGKISRGGNRLLRAHPFEAATVLLYRMKKWSSLKA